MMRFPSLLCALLCCALFFGCGKGDKGVPEPGKSLSAREKKERMKALQKELERLKAELADLEDRAKKIETDLQQARTP